MFGLFWVVYFSIFWARVLWIDEIGNLVASNVNVWGDWTTHFTMGSAMAYRKFFLTTSPFLINAPFSYPFFANALSAALIRSGIDFYSAFVWPSWLFSILSVGTLLTFYWLWFKSKRIAVIASLLLLLNGGFGFVTYIQDVLHSKSPAYTALNPPHKYTQMSKKGIEVPLFIDSLIVPQRALTHGFPVGLGALCLILYAMKINSQRRAYWMCAMGAGLLLGILPIVHTHSFLVMFIVLAFWSAGDVAIHVQERKQRLIFWGIVLGVTSILAMPILMKFFVSQSGGHFFIQWRLGWMARSGFFNWLVFWLKNWGLVPVLALLGLKSDADTRRKSVPFFLLFVLLNIFIFQPWKFDNTKILIWAAVGFSGLAASYLDRQRKWIAIPLFLVSIFSGSIDAARLLNHYEQNFIMYSPEELFLADWAKTNTSPDSIWVLGERYHSWLTNLTGRKTVFTHPTLLWSHGYDYHTVQLDNREMLASPGRTPLFDQYKVDYIVVGGLERDKLGIDQSAFEKVYPAAIKTETYTVFSTHKDIQQTEVLALAQHPNPESKKISLLHSLPRPDNAQPGLVETITQGPYFYSLNPHVNFGVTSINFDFKDGDPKFFKSPVTISWSGFIEITQTGIYEFQLTSDDGSWLLIDGEKVIDNGGIHSKNYLTRKIELSEGWHEIQIKYFDDGGGAALYFDWDAPAGMADREIGHHLFYTETTLMRGSTNR